MKSGILYLLIKTFKLELKVSNDATGVTFRLMNITSRDLFSITLRRSTVISIYRFLDNLRTQLDIPDSNNK